MRRISGICLCLIAAPAMMSPITAQPGPLGTDPFSQGRFDEAKRGYEQALALNANDGVALAGLARAHLYDGEEDEAIALANKALAITPDSPVARAALAMAQGRKAAFGPGQYVMQPNQAATIKFIATDPLPVVSVMIGARQANFLIDTGAPDIMVSPQLAKELGLAVADGGQGVFAGGQRANVGRTLVPSLRIGSVEIGNVPAGVLGMGGAPGGGNQIEGIIGTRLLMHFLSTLDYCRGELVLAPRADSARFESQAQANGANSVRMWFVGDHFIFARGRLNQGAEGMFHIDTGLAGGGLMASKETMDDAGIAPDMSKVLTGIGGGGEVKFVQFRASATMGKLTRNDVVGNYTIGGNQFGIFPFRVSGILSHGFFRQSRLTFDFQAMRLVTQDC